MEMEILKLQFKIWCNIMILWGVGEYSIVIANFNKVYKLMM